ncbi:MAG: YihY/virulence factor BrkB family protein [Pirellulales bacterium]|nr:YihY/virulence factor BrkB family protein [Pirellulales bacterium]
MPDWIKGCTRPFRQALRRWREDDGSLLAAALAFHGALAFLPVVLVLVAGLGLVLRFSGRAQDAQATLLALLAQNASTAVAGHVRDTLAQVQSGSSLGGPAAVVVLLLSGMSAFAQLDKVMDRIWGLGKPRSEGVLAAIRVVLLHRLRAFLMLLGLGILVLAAFAANLMASAARPWAFDLLGYERAWGLIQTAASLAVNGALLTTIYVVLPKVRVFWRHASMAGAMAAVLWEITRQVLSLAVFGRQYTAYGLIGSVLILMIWAYLASAIFLFCAEFLRAVRDNSSATTPRELKA